MMNEGQKRGLSQITFNGVIYNIYLMCQMNSPNVYIISLCKGDWQAANPEVLGTALLDDTSLWQTKYPNPEDYVNWAVGILQTEWAKVQGSAPPPIPVTWSEKLEAFLLRVAFFRNADGTYTIKIV